MATAKRIRVDIATSEEVKARFLDLARDAKKTQGETLEILLEGYQAPNETIAPKPVSFTANLDNRIRKPWFVHLRKAGKPNVKFDYQKPLAESKHTLKELIETALQVSGKTSEEFLEAALIAQSKMELSLNAKREADKGEPDPRDAKLKAAFALLTEQIEKGEYTPQQNRLGVTKLATVAKVSYLYAMQWAEANQPELLKEGNGYEEIVEDSAAKYDLEVAL